jgi:hypothetical protein
LNHDQLECHPLRSARIEYLPDFINSVKDFALDRIPVTMPRDVGSLGFDTPLWVGLGMVGLWATLDAFAQRAGLQKGECKICKRSGCLAGKFDSVTDATHRTGLQELEDIRHLYAHNYAGKADDEYFKPDRHVFAAGVSSPLACGAQFNGSELLLGLPDLTFYCHLTTRVLEAALPLVRASGEGKS